MLKITALLEQLPAPIFRMKITSTLKEIAKCHSNIDNIQYP
jgi:hypothetical protein